MNTQDIYAMAHARVMEMAREAIATTCSANDLDITPNMYAWRSFERPFDGELFAGGSEVCS